MCGHFDDEERRCLESMMVLGSDYGHTGERVMVPGRYRSLCGFEKDLVKDDSFPSCFGQPTTWGLMS